MATEQTSGQITTDGTEQTLATVTAAGAYQFQIDANALADDDEIEIRIYQKVRTGTTSRVMLGPFTLRHAQGEDDIWVAPALLAVHEYKVTIKRTGGVDRTYDWSIFAA